MPPRAKKPRLGRLPLVDEVGKALRTDGATYSYDPADLAPLRERALAISKGQILLDLVVDLLRLVAFLKVDYNAPQAAATLLDELVAPLGDRLAEVADAQLGEEERAEDIKRQIKKQREDLTREQGPLAALPPKAKTGVGLRRK